MKQFFLTIIVSVMAGIAVHAQAKPKLKIVNPAATRAKPAAGLLKNPLDSFSYALGLNIASNLKQQGIDKINYASMQKALDDVFNMKPVLLDDKQANKCIQQKLQENMAKRNDLDKAKIAIVKTQGTTFLAANKKREGVITLPDGLQYEVLKKGDASSPALKLQDTFVVHYAGTLIDGRKFDNSYDRGQPLTMAVSDVINGWKEILQLMHVGDKWKAYIPSELGYGDRGSGANIPGGSTLIFELELLGIKPAATPETPKQN
ncbi:MAG: FKBP-type peptidyl-prolyl cis-trans isomerase [Ferruginibacter sp.]